MVSRYFINPAWEKSGFGIKAIEVTSSDRMLSHYDDGRFVDSTFDYCETGDSGIARALRAVSRGNWFEFSPWPNNCFATMGEYEVTPW